MRISRISRPVIQFGLVLILSLLLSNSGSGRVIYLPLISSGQVLNEPQPMRGVWVTPWSITSKEDVDHVIQRAEAGGFNTIFACIFYAGQTLYPSQLAKTHLMVKPGFDPLAYIVSEAHQRNISVQAWFVVGKLTDGGKSPLLEDHPDWGLVGPDGGSMDWLNFSRPEVRQFIGALASEVVERYAVDGVHLDYIRYPGPEWGFDPYSMETFTKEYNLDANQLRYADLPAYGEFKGNPLANPSTAQILATFANGNAAVAINQYGQGQVILFNWQADRRNIAVNSEILRRSLQRLLQPGGTVFILNSETNSKKYGNNGLNQVKSWLEFLGWVPQEVNETGVKNISPESVLVLPQIYLISQETATQMADFVRGGGGMIIIDGPSLSINIPEIQAITGMQSRGEYFDEYTILEATGEDSLIPTSQRQADINLFKNWDMLWKDFRREGVTLTVQKVQQSVKSISSGVKVSAVQAVANQATAREVFMQDWPTWLQQGYIDNLIPLAYVENAADLGPILAAWQPTIKGDNRVIFGLISYTGGDAMKIPKSPDQLLAEIQMLRQNGLRDYVIFDLASLTDEQLAVLKADSQTTMPPTAYPEINNSFLQNRK